MRAYLRAGDGKDPKVVLFEEAVEVYELECVDDDEGDGKLDDEQGKEVKEPGKSE